MYPNIYNTLKCIWFTAALHNQSAAVALNTGKALNLLYCPIKHKVFSISSSN